VHYQYQQQDTQSQWAPVELLLTVLLVIQVTVVQMQFFQQLLQQLEEVVVQQQVDLSVYLIQVKLEDQEVEQVVVMEQD
jgi:hypothetical protein